MNSFMQLNDMVQKMETCELQWDAKRYQPVPTDFVGYTSILLADDLIYCIFWWHAEVASFK